MAETTKTTKKEKKVFKFPKKMGPCADRLYELKLLLSGANKAVNEVKEEQTALKAYLIDNVPKDDATGAIGKTARVTIVQKSRPELEDFEALIAWCIKKKDFTVLGRALNAEAIEKLWEQGTVVPGVKKFSYKSISLNKL